MRLGVLGGTFNPIHLGHLILAETARERCALDQVWFMPTAIPPHKSRRGMLEARRRLRLVRLAIRGHPAFRVSDLEIRRGGTSYTLETVRALRRRLPRARIFLIVGADMLRVRWYGWTQLRRLCTFVVADRADTLPAGEAGRSHARHSATTSMVVAPEVARAARRGRDTGRQRTRGVRRLKMPEVGISSSMIRRRIRQGQSIRFLVPESVARVIAREGFYRARGR